MGRIKRAVKAVLGPLCRRVMAREFEILAREAARYRDLLVERQEELDRLIPLLSQWVDCWREYLGRRSDELPGLMATLTNGMDDESKHQAQHLLMLYQRLVPKLDKFWQGRFDKDAVYTSHDLALMREIKESSYQVPESFRFPQGVIPEKEAFYLAFGLKFLPEQAMQLIRGRDVIDGGAYVGDSALLFLANGARTVFGFEPDTRNYQEFIETISLNHAEGKIVPVKMALGSERRRAQLYCRDSQGVNMGASVVCGTQSGEPCETYDVDVIDVDSFVRENRLQPGLIKLDVEGAEYDTVSGAAWTIRHFSPLLIVSLYHHPRDFFEIRPLIDRIRPYYHFEIRRCGFVNPVTDIVLLAYPNGPAPEDRS